MKVRPLSGQVLVEILPHDKVSPGGIEIPQRSLSPEEIQDTHLNPEKPKPWFGMVRSIGKWPKLKGGLTLMPEFGVNAKVIIRHNAGTPFQDGTHRRLRMVSQSDVLAIYQDTVAVQP